MNFIETYNNKKVFVTGHTGFKGSWLTAWLHSLGATVKGYALSPRNDKDLYNAINGNELCESVIGDVRDRENVKEEILKFQPDFVFHLAAQPLVIESYLDPIYTYEVNATGTANVLDALRFLQKPCVVVMITTDKVYHNYEKGEAYKEEDRLGGYDPYSASKTAAEIIIDSYRNSFFNINEYSKHQKSISVARAGNVIGGGDWAKNRIIPDIVGAIQNSEPIKVRNPESVRPWQHVLEPLAGYLKLACLQTKNPIKFAEAYNFGPKLYDNITVKELAEKAIEYWDKGIIELMQPQEAVHEAKLLQLDITKAMTRLEWVPKLNSSQAVYLTITWYKQVLVENADARALTIHQILDYSKL